jgi:anion-transporting  ArsA/GET3 family ATPase
MGLSDALRVGPVKRQSDWLIGMLRDPQRTRVHLVTLPEEMPVTETLETAEALQDKVGIDMGALFANAVYTELFTEDEVELLDERDASDRRAELIESAKAVRLMLDDADVDELIGYARFLQARRRIQSGHLTEIRNGVKEPIVELPFLFSAGLALPDIENLADVIEQRIDEL